MTTRARQTKYWKLREVLGIEQSRLVSAINLLTVKAGDEEVEMSMRLAEMSARNITNALVGAKRLKLSTEETAAQTWEDLRRG